MRGRQLMLALLLTGAMAVLSIASVSQAVEVSHSGTASLYTNSSVPTQLIANAQITTDVPGQLALHGELYKNGVYLANWCSASLPYQSPGTFISASSSLTMPLEDYSYFLYQTYNCNTHNWSDYSTPHINGTYWTATSSSLTRQNKIGGYYINYSGSSVASVCSSGVSVQGWLYKNSILQASSSSGQGSSPRTFSGTYLDNAPNVQFTLQTTHYVNGITSYLNKSLSVGPIDWE